MLGWFYGTPFNGGDYNHKTHFIACTNLLAITGCLGKGYNIPGILILDTLYISIVLLNT